MSSVSITFGGLTHTDLTGVCVHSCHSRLTHVTPPLLHPTQYFCFHCYIPVHFILFHFLLWCSGFSFNTSHSCSMKSYSACFIILLDLHHASRIPQVSFTPPLTSLKCLPFLQHKTPNHDIPFTFPLTPHFISSTHSDPHLRTSLFLCKRTDTLIVFN